MLCIVFDAEGLDAAEHCGEGFHVGQYVSGFDIELVDLAASVDVLGTLEARLGQRNSRRSNHCLLVILFGVEESCYSKVSTMSLTQERRC